MFSPLKLPGLLHDAAGEMIPADQSAANVTWGKTGESMDVARFRAYTMVGQTNVVFRPHKRRPCAVGCGRSESPLTQRSAVWTRRIALPPGPV